MKVLSLFDGISCGQLALQRAAVKISQYYSSEIHKQAIKVTQHHFPKTIQLGNVLNLDVSILPKIDILIGGSPCQGFSFAGKMKGASTKCNIEITSLGQYLKLKKAGFQFQGQSYLIWEYIRILSELKGKNPNILFFLENVVMQKKWEKVITEALGVEPILINSALVSAQNRKRLYWTNIPNIQQPKDKEIYLKDILEDKKYLNKATIVGRRINKQGKREDNNKELPNIQCLEVRATNTNKSNTLTTVSKDNVLTKLPIGRYLDAYGKLSGVRLPFRELTPVECERLQTLPDNYTNLLAKTQRQKTIGDGWTVDVVAHFFKNTPLR